MFKVNKKEVDIYSFLKKKIEIICSFCNVTPNSIRALDNTNLAYLEPHRFAINDNMYYIL